MNLISDVPKTISSDSVPRILRTLIVCGNCAGDGLFPVMTNLTSDGRCDNCGSRSFERASQICGALAKVLKNEKN